MFAFVTRKFIKKGIVKNWVDLEITHANLAFFSDIHAREMHVYQWENFLSSFRELKALISVDKMNLSKALIFPSTYAKNYNKYQQD